MPSSLHALPQRPRYAPLRLCSGKGGYEAIPDRKARLDLDRVRAALEATGLGVVDARVMLIVSLAPEVTLSQDGRILVKTRDSEAARRAVEELWRRIESGAEGPIGVKRPGSVDPAR